MVAFKKVFSSFRAFNISLRYFPVGRPQGSFKERCEATPPMLPLRACLTDMETIYKFCVICC